VLIKFVQAKTVFKNECKMLIKETALSVFPEQLLEKFIMGEAMREKVRYSCNKTNISP
jgi:hypothetical protein